jgi:hypothetical protein
LNDCGEIWEIDFEEAARHLANQKKQLQAEVQCRIKSRFQRFKDDVLLAAHHHTPAHTLSRICIESLFRLILISSLALCCNYEPR